MLYTVEQIVDALCNEYEALFTQKTFNPASDLSYDEYRNAMLKKTLPELIQDTYGSRILYSRHIYEEIRELIGLNFLWSDKQLH